MADNGIIDSLFDKKAIEEETKSIEKLMVDLSDEIKQSLIEMVRVYNEELKTASDFDFKGLKEAMNKFNAEVQKTSILKQQQEILIKRIEDAQKEEAVAIEKVRLALAEQNRENKIKAQADLANGKNVENYIKLVNEQGKSIKELTEQNKKLRQLRDSLDTDKQTTEIAALNAVINLNTDTIKRNQDKYVDWKMNIGHYESAPGKLKEILLATSAEIQSMAKCGDTQSEAYKKLQEDTAKITGQIEELK
ncbi:MAG: hypothetical protein LBD91_05460 [Prevotellaceae bacterium]|jgi:hypothetical protein|nr:hypothetical protein [Prevotellaceae bacterium]